MYAFLTSSQPERLLAGWRQAKHAGPLSAVILLHLVGIHALLQGLSQRPTPPVKNEVFATFIVPEKKEAEPPEPKAAPPQVVPVVQKVVPRPVVQPVVNNIPLPQAISVPAAATPADNAVAAMPAAVAPQVVSEAVVQPKTILSGIEYIEAPQPDYPAISRRLRETGDVTLRVLVNEKGKAERVDIEKTSGSARLDEAARQAMQRAIFKPRMEDGKAVAIYAIAVIGFSLNR